MPNKVTGHSWGSFQPEGDGSGYIVLFFVVVEGCDNF